MSAMKVFGFVASINSIVMDAVERLRTGEELLEVEREVFAQLLEMGQVIMQVSMDTVLEDERFKQEKHDAARRQTPRMRSKGRSRVVLQTLFGRIVVKTTYWVRDLSGRPGKRRKKRRKGGSGVHPVLWMMGIYERCTPAYLGEVGRAMTLCSSSREAAQLLETRGIKLPSKTVCRLAYALGQRALDARDHRLAHLESIPKSERILEGRRVALALDGGRCRLREPYTKGRRNAKGRRAFDTPWREPKGFILYVIDDKGRPHPDFKPICDFTLGDADAFIELLISYLHAYGIREAELLIILADGAPWIWNRIPFIDAALAIEEAGVEVYQCLDYYHAAQHLHKVSNLPGRWSGNHRKHWLKTQTTALYEGRIEEVVGAIDALRTQVGKRKRKTVLTERDYFDTNKDRMRYHHMSKMSLPIGSGAIESAVRRVINLRLKSNATFWLPENAERIMHMRAQLKTGRFDDMLRYATTSYPKT